MSMARLSYNKRTVRRWLAFFCFVVFYSSIYILLFILLSFLLVLTGSLFQFFQMTSKIKTSLEEYPRIDDDDDDDDDNE